MHRISALFVLLLTAPAAKADEASTETIFAEGVALLTEASDLNGISSEHWTLEKDDGSRVELIWAMDGSDQPPVGLQSATRVRVQGFNRTTTTETTETPHKNNTIAVEGFKVAFKNNATAESKLAPENSTIEESVLVVSNVLQLNSSDTMVSTQGLLRAPQRLSVAIFVHDMSVCNPSDPTAGKPQMTAAEVERLMFEKKGGGGSVEGQLRACSYGRLYFHPSNMKVFVVKMPRSRCSASHIINGWRHSYTWNDCVSPTSMHYFLDVIERVAVMRHKVDLRPYQHRWHITASSQARGPNCWWAGMATVGCGARGPDRAGLCRIISNSAQPFVWMHESGHTLGLDHAGRGRGATTDSMRVYGDEGCVLGGWGRAPYGRCYNLPNAVRLSIVVPQTIRALDITGKWKAFAISAANLQRNNGLRIVTSVRTAVPRTNVMLFVSYRQQKAYPEPNVGGDTELDGEYVGLLVHLWPDPRPGGGARTSWEGRIPRVGPLGRFREQFTGIVLQLVKATSRSVIFKACQRTRVGRSYAIKKDICGSRKDDNCDGIVGTGCPEQPIPIATCGNGVCDPGGVESPLTCHADCCRKVKQTCRVNDDCCDGLYCVVPSGSSIGNCSPLEPPRAIR